MNSPKNQYRAFGSFRLYLDPPILLRDGKTVALQNKDLKVLSTLIERAGQVVSKDQMLEAGWPDSFVEEANLNVHVSNLRKALGRELIETIPRRGYRFALPVSDAQPDETGPFHMPSPPACEEFEADGGAVSPASPFYIERPTDDEFRAAVKRRDSIILVKGARQVGKTSLLVRELAHARQAGAAVVWTDLQVFNNSVMRSPETFLIALADQMADQLDAEYDPELEWKSWRAPNINFNRFMTRTALAGLDGQLIWALDEVDRLFSCNFYGDIFSNIRSWHNARDSEPRTSWKKLTVALAYSTEIHLFIQGNDQSPFNVGTMLELGDFTLDKIVDLNQRYRSPLHSQMELESFYQMIGGNPYLVRRSLHTMAERKLCLGDFLQIASSIDGPLSSHLRHLVTVVSADAALHECMKSVVDGKPCLTEESFYRLRSAGFIAGDSPSEARPRSELYRVYLSRHL